MPEHRDNSKPSCLRGPTALGEVERLIESLRPSGGESSLLTRLMRAARDPRLEQHPSSLGVRGAGERTG